MPVSRSEHFSDRVELVLDIVESIPPGRVMTYGAVAEYMAELSGQPSSPRYVGTVLAKHGGSVCWHRVVNSVGRLPLGHERTARDLLESEGVPFSGTRVRVDAASWWPAASTDSDR